MARRDTSRPLETPLADRVRAHLRDLLASEQFSRSERLSAFLVYVVNHTLSGNAADLKERNIAVDVYGKPGDFDARLDPVVRVDARRLRDKLREYYAANPAQDLFIVLPKGSYTPAFEGPATVNAEPGRRSRAWLYGAASLALAVGAFALASFMRESPLAAPTMRVLLRPPEGLDMADLRTAGQPVLSPDGRSVALVATAAAKGRTIWIQKLDEVAASPLPGTEDASYLFWSPDGSHLGFFAHGKLKKVDIVSGAVQTLCDAPSGRGGAWSSAGVLLFSPKVNSPLFRIAGSGGPVTAVTSQRDSESHVQPGFLPDGERFVYNSQLPGTQYELHLGSLADPSLNRRLFTVTSHAVYAAGHLLFVRESILTALPFDAAAGQVAGESRAIASGVATSPERPFGDFSVSANGILLYRQTATTSPELAWYDRRGSVRSTAPVRSDRDVSLSPTGRFLSTVEFDRVGAGVDLWLHDMKRGTRARITSGEGIEYNPWWSHDGRTLYFTDHQLPQFHLYRLDVLAAGAPSRLAERSDWFVVTDISPDDAFLLLQVRTVRGDYDLLRFNTASRTTEPFLQTRFSEAQARISPDGRWLAYVSDETGRYEVYVARLDNVAVRVPVSQAGGLQPRWRHDGRELFFLSLDGHLMALAAPWQNSFPVKLFATAIDAKSVDAIHFPQYAVSADGGQFLIRSASGNQASPPWMLVANWPAMARSAGR